MNYQMLREILAARRNSFVFLIFLVLLNLALYLYLSMWQRPQVLKEQNAWFAKREALAKGQTVGVATAYQNGLRDLASFQARIIPKRDFARFLNQLYDTAKRDSLVIRGVNYKPASIKEEGLVSYGISFTVSGRYPAVKSFIADVARYKEIVTLDSISLSNASPVEESVDLRVDMTVYLKTEGT